MPRIEYTQDVVADLEKIDGAARKVILKAIGEKLGTEPEQFGDPLARRHATGSLAPFRKLKVGRNSTYRVVYYVHRETEPQQNLDDSILVIVWIVAKRSDDEVYRDAKARIEAMSHQLSAGQLTPGQLEHVLANAWQR
jgi:mRNA interferase RelE/StbE